MRWLGEAGDDRRILFTANDLVALYIATGRSIESFGEGARVNLRDAIERDISGLRMRAYSPGAIYGDLIILGVATGRPRPGEGGRLEERCTQFNC